MSTDSETLSFTLYIQRTETSYCKTIQLKANCLLSNQLGLHNTSHTMRFNHNAYGKKSSFLTPLDLYTHETNNLA